MSEQIEYGGLKEREITPEEEQYCEEVFDNCDKDEYGNMFTNQLGEALRECGANPTEDELKTMIETINANNDDGLVSREDFLHFYKCLRSPEEENANLKEAFRMIDTDGSGKIDKDELREFLGCNGESITDDDLNCLIESVDVDQDGKLDATELANLLTRIPRPTQEEGEFDG